MRKTMYEDALEAEVQQRKDEFTTLAEAITKLIGILDELGLCDNGSPSEVQEAVDSVEKLL